MEYSVILVTDGGLIRYDITDDQCSKALILWFDSSERRYFLYAEKNYNLKCELSLIHI